MTRGEIWWADFGIPFGSEPGFKRPVIIIQDDSFNQSKINTVIVIPLTTNLLLSEAPGNVFLEKNEYEISKDSVAIVSQLSVLDKNRLLNKVIKLDRNKITEIEDGIRLVLGIQ